MDLHWVVAAVKQHNFFAVCLLVNAYVKVVYKLLDVDRYLYALSLYLNRDSIRVVHIVEVEFQVLKHFASLKRLECK